MTIVNMANNSQDCWTKHSFQKSSAAALLSSSDVYELMFLKKRWCASEWETWTCHYFVMCCCHKINNRLSKKITVSGSFDFQMLTSCFYLRFTLPNIFGFQNIIWLLVIKYLVKVCIFFYLLMNYQSQCIKLYAIL